MAGLSKTREEPAGKGSSPLVPPISRPMAASMHLRHVRCPEIEVARSTAAFFAGGSLVVCQLAIDYVDSAFSTCMDMAGVGPSFINIRRRFIGLILSIALCPWKLLSSVATFISVLSAYSVLLGPMVAIQVCNYWIRRPRTKLTDLYHPQNDGFCCYWQDMNWRSFVYWVVGWAYLLPGVLHAVTPNFSIPVACTDLYYLEFPLGPIVSFPARLAINNTFPLPGLDVAEDVGYYRTFSPDEAMDIGIVPGECLEGSDVTMQAATEKEIAEPVVRKV